MLSYFMSYANEGLEPLPKLGKYLTFVARTILTFGLSFQIPFLMVMAGKADLVQAAYFKLKRMYFYIAILVLSFLLTAGDFMATALLAIPRGSWTCSSPTSKAPTTPPLSHTLTPPPRFPQKKRKGVVVRGGVGRKGLTMPNWPWRTFLVGPFWLDPAPRGYGE